MAESNPKQYGVFDPKSYDLSKEQFENGNILAGANAGIGDFVRGLWADLTGEASQSREFDQQEYLQDKMNEYNTPAAQMARMRAAGINPNLAAQGIAGGGNESAQAPAVNSAVGGVAGAVDSLANLGNVIGENSLRKSQKADLDTFRNPTFQKLWNEATLALENAGLSHNQALAIGATLPYIDAIQQATFWNLMADYDNKSAEYKNILQQYDNFKAEEKLTREQAKYYQEMQDNVNADTQNSIAELLGKKAESWLKDQLKQFSEKIGIPFNPSDPFSNYCMFVLNFDKDNAQKIANAAYDFTYKMNSGQYEAQFEAENKYAGKIESARAKARAMAEIITDWNTSSNGMWSLLDKVFNVSRSGHQKQRIGDIGDPLKMLENPEIYSEYLEACNALQMNIDSITEDINIAANNNELGKVRELSRQRQKMMEFVKEFTYENYTLHYYGKPAKNQ